MIKLGTIRSFYGKGKYQFSTEAAAEIAHYLNENGEAIVEKSEAILEKENEYRRIQGLEELKRITARHVKEVLENEG